MNGKCTCSADGPDGAVACSCDHDHDHDHNHEHDHDEEFGSATVTMVDQETGEEFTFEMVDSLELDGETYCLLATVSDEPEAIFVRVVTLEDGTEGLLSLEEDEFDRVAEAYDRLLEESDDEADVVLTDEEEDR